MSISLLAAPRPGLDVQVVRVAENMAWPRPHFCPLKMDVPRVASDFGDGWEHEIEFEGAVQAEPNKKYPCCVDGQRACPPEDVGGVWGYPEFLEAIRNPKHEEHESFMEWIGGEFNSEAFSAMQATKAMRKGLPNWRAYR